MNLDFISFASLLDKSYFVKEQRVALKLQNFVVKGELNKFLNLQYVCQTLRHLGPQYDPVAFAALILRVQTPTTLFFQAGNFVCAGSKNFFNVCWVIIFLINQIRAYVYKDIAINNISAKNIVVTLNLQYKIDLETMAEQNESICTFDPKAFPGARLHPFTKAQKKIMALVFRTGRVVIVGIKNKESFQEFIDYFLEFITTYLKD
jgi:TATA-box binding protein (TBP) (component of TFIID and TFIIIB)